MLGIINTEMKLNEKDRDRGGSWLEDLERKKKAKFVFPHHHLLLRFVLFKIKWLGHGLQQMEELGAVNRLLRIIILVFFID